jgi:hypothetical protein
MPRLFLMKLILLVCVAVSNAQSITLPRNADKWQIVSAFFEGKYLSAKRVYLLGAKHGDLSEEPFLWVDTIFRYKSGDKEYQHVICVKSQKDNECVGCQVAVSQIRLVWNAAKSSWLTDFFIEDQFETGSNGQPGAFALLPLTNTEFALAVEDDFTKDGVMSTWYYLYSRNSQLLEIKLVEDNSGAGVEEGSVYSFQAGIQVDRPRGILTIQRYGTQPQTDSNGKKSVLPVKELFRYLYKDGSLIKL